MSEAKFSMKTALMTAPSMKPTLLLFHTKNAETKKIRVNTTVIMETLGGTNGIE